MRALFATMWLARLLPALPLIGGRRTRFQPVFAADVGDAGAPPLPSDAPGSAAQRVGAPDPGSPLESWLSSLFGSGG